MGSHLDWHHAIVSAHHLGHVDKRLGTGHRGHDWTTPKMCLPAPGGHPPNSQPRTLRPLLSPQPTALLQVTKPWGRAGQHSIPAAQSPASRSTQGQGAAPGQPSPHLQVLQVCVLQLLRGCEDLQPRRTRCGRGCDDKETLGGPGQEGPSGEPWGSGCGRDQPGEGKPLAPCNWAGLA